MATAVRVPGPTQLRKRIVVESVPAEPKDDIIRLDLTVEEATALADILGNILSDGPVQQVTTAIWRALRHGAHLTQQGSPFQNPPQIRKDYGRTEVSSSPVGQGAAKARPSGC